MSALFHGTSYAEPGSFERTLHDAMTSWVAQRIPQMAKTGATGFGPAVVFVVVDRPDPINGKPLAAVVFHNHVPGYRSMEVSMASVSPMWAKPSHISTMLRYVFVTNGCERLQAVVARRGRGPKRTARFLRHLGFKFEGTGRRAFGYDDALMYSMLREDATRWLEGRDDALAA